jgi:multiple sugar transport system substrate-binding protein
VEKKKMKILKSILLALAIAMGGSVSAADLTLLVPSGPDGDGLRMLGEDYEKLTGVSIESVQVPYVNAREKIFTACSTRSGSFDVYLLDDPWFQGLADANCLERLTDYFTALGTDGPDNDFVGHSLALCRNPYSKGPFYCLPYVGNAMMFFYNPTMLEEAGYTGPMDTWEDVKKSAKIVAEKGRRRKFGYMMAANQLQSFAGWLAAFWSYGGKVLGEDGKTPSLNSEAGRTALDLWIELAESAPPGVEGMAFEELMTNLTQRVASTAIFWPIFVSILEDPDQSKVVGEMKYTALPFGTVPGKGMIGHWLTGISTESKNKQAAFDFINWASAPEQIKTSALRGNSPVRISVFEDPELISQDRFRFFPVLLDSIRNSIPRPRHKNWEQMAIIIGEEINAVMSGTKSRDEGLAAADARIAPLLE